MKFLRSCCAICVSEQEKVEGKFMESVKKSDSNPRNKKLIWLEEFFIIYFRGCWDVRQDFSFAYAGSGGNNVSRDKSVNDIVNDYRASLQENLINF